MVDCGEGRYAKTCIVQSEAVGMRTCSGARDVQTQYRSHNLYGNTRFSDRPASAARVVVLIDMSG